MTRGIVCRGTGRFVALLAAVGLPGCYPGRAAAPTPSAPVAVHAAGVVAHAAPPCAPPPCTPPPCAPPARPAAPPSRRAPTTTASTAPSGAPTTAPALAPPAVRTGAPTTTARRPAGGVFAEPGFVVFEDDRRLWVFRERSEALEDFLRSGEPAKRVTRIGAGPEGRTLMSADAETLDAYTAPRRHGRPGFAVSMEDGRLWVFRAGSAELADFQAHGEPAKRVTKIGAGPDGLTLLGPDAETLEAYLVVTRYAAPGYAVALQDGRLWVFREGSAELADYRAHGEPAKRVTRIGAGPDGRTVVGPDAETVEAYVAAARYGAPGFVVLPADGRLWVFREGSDDLAAFHASGEPAKRVTRIGAGPDGRTLIGPDAETLDGYLASRR